MIRFQIIQVLAPTTCSTQVKGGDDRYGTRIENIRKVKSVLYNAVGRLQRTSRVHLGYNDSSDRYMYRYHSFRLLMTSCDTNLSTSVYNHQCTVPGCLQK